MFCERHTVEAVAIVRTPTLVETRLAGERVMIGGSRMAALERAFDRLTSYLRTAKVTLDAPLGNRVVLDVQQGLPVSVTAP